MLYMIDINCCKLRLN